MKKTVVHSNVEIRGDGHLYFAGVDTVPLAKKYGTPLFLIDEARVRERAREYVSALKENHQIRVYTIIFVICCRKLECEISSKNTTSHAFHYIRNVFCLVRGIFIH